MMTVQNVLFMDEMIINELEGILDYSLKKSLSGRMIYMITDEDLLPSEKKEKARMLHLQIYDIFSKNQPIGEMIYQAKFSESKKMLLVTSSPLKIDEGNQERITTCFYHRDRNDISFITSDYEVTDAKQLLKILKTR